MTIFQDKRLTLCLFLTYIVALAFAVPGQFGVQATEAPLTSVCRENVGECLSVRAGGSEEDSAEGVIQTFLSQKQLSLQKFHVHGWRWHTLSLVREAGRLQKLAERSTSNEECNPLKQAAEYVVGFNLKGLHKIEADLFFPWMREKLTGIQENDVATAFAKVMDQLETDRKRVSQLGESIQQKVTLVCDKSKPSSARSEAILGLAQDSAALESCARSMMERENTLLVPAIAEVVPASEQKSFNNKVLRNLGILDSRLHLVHMHEAVLESNIAEEKELFQQAIPSLPQRMIPRWKRNLYLPRTQVLDP